MAEITNSNSEDRKPATRRVVELNTRILEAEVAWEYAKVRVKAWNAQAKTAQRAIHSWRYLKSLESGADLPRYKAAHNRMKTEEVLGALAQLGAVTAQDLQTFLEATGEFLSLNYVRTELSHLKSEGRVLHTPAPPHQVGGGTWETVE